MNAPHWVRCPGCGREFNGARGLRAHAATKFLDGACKFGARQEADRIAEAAKRPVCTDCGGCYVDGPCVCARGCDRPHGHWPTTK